MEQYFCITINLIKSFYCFTWCFDLSLVQCYVLGCCKIGKQMNAGTAKKQEISS